MSKSNQKGSIRFWILPSNVAVFQFNCPDSKMNVFSTEVMNELNDLLDYLKDERAINGLILCSAKPGCFIAGANINEIEKLQKLPKVESYLATQKGKEVFAKLADLPYPTVAAIDGVCLGGGLECALACSYRLVTEKSKCGFPEVKLGLLPGWGGCIRTPALIGIPNALAMILDPDRGAVDGKKAWHIGLADEVVASEKLMDRAEEIILFSEAKRARQKFLQKIWHGFLGHTRLGRMLVTKQTTKQIKKGTGGHYPAPWAARKVVLASTCMPADKAAIMESNEFAELAHTDVSKNLVGVYFADQEAKKVGSGARPALEIKNVGVLGAGVMGAGIAQAALYAGYNVVLYDLYPGSLAKGRKTIVGLFDNLVKAKKLKPADVDKIMSRLVTTVQYQPLANCHLVIEAVVENMAVKQQNWAEVEKVNTCFIAASNTSSLDVDEQMSRTRDPHLTGGLHFFNPVHKLPLVEVVKGAKTSDQTVAALLAFVASLKKVGVVTGNRPGFVVNDILTPYMLEAGELMACGVPAADIDKAMKDFGMPMGPIALIDEVGLDIAFKVAHVLHDAYGSRIRIPAIVSWLEARNQEIDGLNKKIREENVQAEKAGQPTKPEITKFLGRKVNKGIFAYDAEGKATGVHPEVAQAIPADVKHKSKNEIEDRLVLVMINEAARCLSAGVVTSASQIDLAMITGTGFPPFRGGVLRHADKLGIKLVVQKLHALAQESGEAYVPCDLLVQMAQEGKTFYPN